MKTAKTNPFDAHPARYDSHVPNDILWARRILFCEIDTVTDSDPLGEGVGEGGFVVVRGTKTI